MKKVIRFIAVALLFLLCFSYTSVLAGDKSTIEDIVDVNDDFEGEIIFDSKDTPWKYQVGRPDVYHGLGGTEAGEYVVHDISFVGNGKTGTAFCVFPHLSARKNNTVRCGKITPQNFPRTYYAAYTYWSELKGDQKLADFVMRSSGILDKDASLNEKRQKFCEGKDKWNEYPECQEPGDVPEGELRYCDQPAHANEFRCTRWGWTGLSAGQTHLESAFVKTWQVVEHNELGQDHGNWEPYVFKGTKVESRGYTILKDVADHTQYVKDNWVTSDTGSGSSNQYDSNVQEGKYVKITKLDPDVFIPKVSSFLIESKDGTDIGPITVTVTGGTLQWLEEWNGRRGVIKVTSDDKCKPKLTVKLGVVTPRVDSCTTKGCRWKPEACDTCGTCDVEPCTEETGSYRDGKNIVYYKYKKCQKAPCPGTKWTCDCSSRTANTNNNDINLETSDIAKEQKLEINSSYATEIYNDSNYINTSINVNDINPNLELYYCSISGQMEQSYIVIVDGETDTDSFNLKIQCDNCYEGDCTPVTPKDKIDEKDLHNCCDGMDSWAVQAALSKLFCTDYTLKVSGYKPKCNAEDYIDTDFNSNIYCKQYCGASIQYNIPGPTRAKSDAFFYFAKNKDGEFTGPTFNEYKRCRTVIKYDLFNKNYEAKVDSIMTNYSDYQKYKSQEEMWNYLNINHDHDPVGGETITCTASVTYSKSWYDNTCTKYDKTHDCCPPEAHAPASATCQCPSEDKYCIERRGTQTDERTQKFDGHSKTVGKYNISKYSVTDTLKNSYSYREYSRLLHNSDDTFNGADAGVKKTNSYSGDYYDQKEMDDYRSDFNSTYDAAKAAAQSDINGFTIPSGYSKSSDNIDCGSTSVTTKTPEIDIAKTISDLSSSASTYQTKYESDVKDLKGLQDALNQCGGMYNGYDSVDPNSLYIDKGVKDRIKFKSEPTMEFEYYQEYKDMETGKIIGTAHKVPFYYVKDNAREEYTDPNDPSKHCVYETKSSLVDTAPEWAAFWNKAGWDDDNYSTNDGNIKTIKNRNYKASIPGYSSGFNAYDGIYWTSRKYTTDAVGHMTCRWSDDKKNKTYTLIPNGIVITEQNIGPTKFTSKNDPKWNCWGGTYGAYKTARAGMFEVYYTLKNIDAPFQDAISVPGETCSGKSSGGAVNFEGKEVNLTCYIEIHDEGWWLEDCTHGDVDLECCNTGSKVCGQGLNCITKCDGVEMRSTLEYKEVDPKDMFPNKSQYQGKEGYAWNWYEGPNGKETLNKITDQANADKIYAPENLTYSFTLTPSDIKKIRAYNKAMIKEGGYGNFNMKCQNQNKEELCTSNSTLVSHCESAFLDAISGGGASLTYSGGTLNLDTDNKPILEVRKNWPEFEYDEKGFIKKK